MIYSGFNTTVTATSINFVGKIFEVDQFPVSEFFSNELGKEKKDIEVMQNSSPEVREKMQEYIIANEVKGFDPSVSDDEVLSSIHSKYDNSLSSILGAIDRRISELRANDV